MCTKKCIIHLYFLKILFNHNNIKTIMGQPPNYRHYFIIKWKGTHSKGNCYYKLIIWEGTQGKGHCQEGFCPTYAKTAIKIK